MNRLQNVKKNINRWGWKRAIFDVAIKIAARLFGVHVYTVRTREIPSVPIYPKTNPNLEFREIPRNEFQQHMSDDQLDLDRDFIDTAITRGDHAFGAYDKSQLVSYTWRSVGVAPDVDGVWISVDRPYNYSYKSFTRANYRGQRISPVVHLYSDNEMRKLGYRSRIGFVSVTNYASLGMGKHMGSVFCGYAGYTVLFGRLLSFRSAAVKRTGFSFFVPDRCR